MSQPQQGFCRTVTLFFPGDPFCKKIYITINPFFEGIVAAAIRFPGEDAPLQVGTLGFYFLQVTAILLIDPDDCSINAADFPWVFALFC